MHPGLHAQSTPDKAAVIMAGSGEVVTYRELDERSNRLAQLLWAQGLRPGDHVAIFAENHPRFFEVFWAAARSGLYFTTVNRYLQAEEAAYIVNDCGATAFVASHGKADVAAEIVDLIPDCPLRLMWDGTVSGYEPYEDRVAEHPAPTARAPAPGRGDAVLLRHDRATQGHQAPPVGWRHQRGAAAEPAAHRHLRHGRREHLPLARAAVPQRPAGLDDLHAVPGRHRGGDGTLRPDRGAGAASNGTASPTASGCRRCSCAC